MWLLLAMAPWRHQMGRMSPAAIAYLGDAVLELHARQHVLWPPADVGAHNDAVRRIVCAKGQYETLKRLRAEFELTEEEEEWLRRGRNASGRGPRSVSAQAFAAVRAGGARGVHDALHGARESRCPPRAATQVYRDSTSLETLLGFLHLSDPARLQQVMDFILESEGAGGGAGQGGEQAGDGPAGSGGAGPTAPG